MNFFVCTYGYFPEQDELVSRSFDQNAYFLHINAKYPSAIDKIESDDVLLLNVRGKGIVAYASAAKSVECIDNKGWNYVIQVKDGWNQHLSRHSVSAYGILRATLQGGQFALVKLVEADWANNILHQLQGMPPSSLLGTKRPNNDDPSTPFRNMAPFDVAGELMDGTLEIPAVQRGFVWNATRLEVLWDSILRGIPIGTFSIRAIKSNGNWMKRWDLLDGQQRATAIMSAYRPFPPRPTKVEQNDDPDAAKNAMLKPVVWIDLLPDPDKQYGRKYVIRVTTASQPWGYKLTSDETENSKIEARQMLDVSIKYDWHGKSEALLANSNKPFPCELIPYGANCAIPLSLVLKCCRNWMENSVPQSDRSIDKFIEFCEREQSSYTAVAGEHPWNWLGILRSKQKDLSEGDKKSDWKNLLKAIYNIDEYMVMQMNAESVGEDDVGIYFRRIGRGGVTPSQEEMNYSMLKAKLPSLKKSMDSFSESGWAAPSRMAMLALRTWQCRQKDVPKTDVVNAICRNPEWLASFGDYTSSDGGTSVTFKKDLDELNNLLKINEGGLLPWHKMVFCTKNNGAICQYLLRLIATGKTESDVNYAGVAAFLLYSSDNVERVISKHLEEAKTIHEGIASAYRDSYWGRPLLKRLVNPQEVSLLLNKVNCDDWIETWKRIKPDPVWQSIVHAITTGYNSESAYSILLFSCREFMNAVFNNYNAFLPIWSEDNCPWDYDHIFPQAKRDDMKTVADGCEDVLDSIGNLAPLPFSLNRSKHDSMPTKDYPLEAVQDTDHALQTQLWKYKSGLMLKWNSEAESLYDYSTFGEMNGINAKEVFLQTIRRFNLLYKNWFDNLSIASVLPTTTERKLFFDSLMKKFANNEFSVWIPGVNEQEIKIDERPFPFGVSDWISSPWISFGKCVGEFFVAYGDDGRGLYTTGICKLPKEVSVRKDLQIPISNQKFETPKTDNYWYVLKKYQTRPTIDEVINDLNILMELANKRSPTLVTAQILTNR